MFVHTLITTKNTLYCNCHLLVSVHSGVREQVLLDTGGKQVFSKCLLTNYWPFLPDIKAADSRLPLDSGCHLSSDFQGHPRPAFSWASLGMERYSGIKNRWCS